MDSFGDSTKETNEKLERLKKIREDLNAQAEKEYELRDENRKAASDGALALKRELDLLIAKGASEKQIYEASKKLKEQERKDINDQIGSLGDSIKRTQELKDNENEMNILDESYKKGIRDKADADNKKAQEKRDADAKKRQEEKKAASEKEMSDLMAALEEENAAEERQNERVRIQGEKEMAELMAQLEAEVKAEQDAADRKVELDKQAALQSLQDKKDIENAKIAIVNDSYLALNALGELALGQQFKNTNAGKALALAQIATDTALGFIQGLRIAQQSAIGLSGPAAALTMPVFYASQVAAVLGAASKAKSLLGGGGSTSAPSGGGGGGGGSISSQPPRMDKFESNRPAMNPNQRVYVLEKDITDSQGRVARIRHNATLI
jgi:chromosome segregation ATPase